VSLLVLCLTLHVALATADPTDDEAKSLAPKATSDEQRAAAAATAKKAQPKAAKQGNLSGQLSGKKGKKPKNKNPNPTQPKTTIPPGPTVDKRVDYVRPVGQSLAVNGGASAGGWPAEIPSKGKRRKGNRKG
jgi:hypothetical protein